MGDHGHGFFSARTMRIFDVLLIAYVVLWATLGVLIATDIRRQADLSDHVTRIGQTLTEIGRGLDVLAGLPLVGGDIGNVTGRVTEAGKSVMQSGQDSRASLERMGVLVGIAFAAVPFLLVLPAYVPLRLGWRREVRAVAAALAAERPDLDLALARRALAAMPYGRLLALGPDPWARLADGDVRELADGELERLGLRRP